MYPAIFQHPAVNESTAVSSSQDERGRHGAHDEAAYCRATASVTTRQRLFGFEAAALIDIIKEDFDLLSRRIR